MFKKTIIAIALLIAIIAAIALTSKNSKHSTTGRKRSYTKNGPVKKVLILGNSIVRHPPLPSIAWNNNWGMAASAIDSDFVHILIRNIKSKDSTCHVMYENIADFEKDYITWDYRKADTFARFKPDLIVMRIAENVNDQQAEENNFIKYYDSLINRIDTSAMVFVCNGWWKNKHVNRLIEQYATESGYPFINQSGLYSPATLALGQYENPDVQQHPNNRGMQKIAESIWNEIRVYF